MDTVCWLEKFICESKMPILYISHDEVLLENTANKILHIEQIKRKTQSRVTLAKSGYREYVDRRMSSFSHQEQVARSERKEFQKQQEKFRQIQQKVEHQQNAISRQDPHGGALLKKTMHRVKAYEARFEKEFRGDKTRLQTWTDNPSWEGLIFSGANTVCAEWNEADANVPEVYHLYFTEDSTLQAEQRYVISLVLEGDFAPEEIRLIKTDIPFCL